MDETFLFPPNSNRQQKRGVQDIPDAISVDKVRRVLIIAPQLLGDAVVSTVLLTALKSMIPHCLIDVLAQHSLSDIFAHNPAVNALHKVDGNWRKRGVLRTLRPRFAVIRALRQYRYDLLIQSPHSTDGSWGPALIWLLRIPYAVGAAASAHGSPLKRLVWRKAFSHMLDEAHKNQPPRHVAEVHLDLLRRIGLAPAPEDRGTNLILDTASTTRIAARLAARKIPFKRFVLFAPTAGNTGRTLSVDLCSEFIARCVADGRFIVLTAGPTDRERCFIESLCRNQGSLVHTLGADLTLAELAALTAAAQVFVGTDSGSMHVAAALHIPVVACFGPGDEYRFGPWQTARRLVTSPRSCRPCDQNGCGNSGQSDCLHDLSAGSLIQALNTLTA